MRCCVINSFGWTHHIGKPERFPDPRFTFQDSFGTVPLVIQKNDGKSISYIICGWYVHQKLRLSGISDFHVPRLKRVVKLDLEWSYQTKNIQTYQHCIHLGRNQVWISKEMAGWLGGVGRAGRVGPENPLGTKGLVVLNSRLGSNGTVPWHPWHPWLSCSGGWDDTHKNH